MGTIVSEKTTIRLEYRKFTTFLVHYVKSLSRGWLFMNMKNRYPLGTNLTFLITVTGIDRILTLTGDVVHHGVNDEGKEGVGIRLTLDQETSDALRRTVEERCRALFGEWISDRIMALAEVDSAGKR